MAAPVTLMTVNQATGQETPAGTAANPSATRDTPFTINQGGNQTRALTVTTTATGGSGVLFEVPETATSVRIKVRAGGGGDVAWTLGSGAAAPLIPVPYAQADGTGGTPGMRTISPGGVETFGLDPDQQTRAAAGTLRLRAVCAAGTAVIEVTLGNGA